jgi:hypothetical protein
MAARYVFAFETCHGPPMAESQSNLVPEHLRHIRSKVDSIDERTGRVQLRLAAVEGHLGGLLLAQAGQNSEIDKIKQRLDHIERRLEPADGELRCNATSPCLRARLQSPPPGRTADTSRPAAPRR